jgi:hypothetical protein
LRAGDYDRMADGLTVSTDHTLSGAGAQKAGDGFEFLLPMLRS